MIEQNAVILALTPTSSDAESIATLEIVRKTACGLCGQIRGCGNNVWGKLLNHKSVNFTAQNSINAKVGDYVIVGINEVAMMRGALLLYMVPLASMLIVAILAQRFAGTNAASILGAIIGLLLGFLWVKGRIAGETYYQQNQAKILRISCEEFEKVVEFQ